MPKPHPTKPRPQSKPDQEYEEKVVQVSRVSKKTKGGNKIGFSVLVVVGDKKGKVGVGLGKGPDVLSSIQKASRRAKKRMIQVPLKGTTIPFPVRVKKGAAVVMLKPAPKGSGVIAGGPVRAVVEAAGIKDIVSKIMGSSNKASNVYVTFEALTKIQQIAKIKGIKLTKPKAEKVLPQPKKEDQKPATQPTKKPAPKSSSAKVTPKPKKA